MQIYSLSSIPYYNSIIQEYSNILILNKMPEGPLKNNCKQIRQNKLSPFEANTNVCRRRDCVIAITDQENSCGFLCVDDLPNLFEFLINNGYTIDQSITKVFQKTNVKMDGELICIIKY